MMRSGLWISPQAFIEIKVEMLTICLVFHLIGSDSMDMDFSRSLFVTIFFFRLSLMLVPLV